MHALSEALLNPLQIVLTSSGPSSLPTDKPVTLSSLFHGYVELSQPATKRDIQILSEARNSVQSQTVLEDLKAHYVEKVYEKRLSVLDILEDHSDIKLSLEVFLQMLPAMRIRQYSISSSPLYNPQRASLTISVLDAPSFSGRKETFLGVGSTFLAGLRVGDKVQLAVRKSNTAFHPPQDPTIPLVMVCAGSGLAPMRGFLQERAIQKEAGRDVAKSLLFFGCHSPQHDFIYGDTDIKQWVELGVVDVRPAFSRSPAESGGCKYVSEYVQAYGLMDLKSLIPCLSRIWYDRADVVAANRAGAKVRVVACARESWYLILAVYGSSSYAARARSRQALRKHLRISFRKFISVMQKPPSHCMTRSRLGGLLVTSSSRLKGIRLSVDHSLQSLFSLPAINVNQCTCIC